MIKDALTILVVNISRQHGQPVLHVCKSSASRQARISFQRINDRVVISSRFLILDAAPQALGEHVVTPARRPSAGRVRRSPDGCNWLTPGGDAAALLAPTPASRIRTSTAPVERC